MVKMIHGTTKEHAYVKHFIILASLNLYIPLYTSLDDIKPGSLLYVPKNRLPY